MVNLKDQVLLITGATGGLGPTVVHTAADMGARLALTGHAAPDLDALVADLGMAPGDVFAAPSNATDEASVNDFVGQTIARLGHVDVLLNVAGGYRGGGVLDIDLADWDFLMALNARSVLLMCRAVVPHMLERGRGKVVNVAARTALQVRPGSAAHSASKSVVIRLTEALSAEVKDKGINVNCVMPSTIDTPANRAAMPKADFSKWATPQEVANVMLFLASDAASGIHGATVPIFGRV
jgi:NAD(P)-dependent dehydrogenase (short-subunit alcohol dehydrogenase family)